MSGRIGRILFVAMAAGALAGGGVRAAEKLSITGVAQTPWVARQDDQPVAESVLTLKNAGAPTRVWVRVAAPERAALIVALGEVAAGDSKVRVRHPEVARDGDKVPWSVFGNEACAGTPLAETRVPMVKARRWTIYVNHDMHQDVGYTGYQEDLKRKVWPGYLDKTIERISQSSQWPDAARARQEVESSMQLYDSALIARDADWVEGLKQLIGEGRVSYSATFGNLAQENCSAEALVRSNYYSRRHLHDMLGGGASAIANMADNNSLCWSAIDTLTGAGVKYYTLRLWGAESRWRAPAPLFYVEAAVSGQRVLVCNYGDYTKEPFNLRSGKIDAVRQAVDARLMALQNSADYPYDAVLCQFTNSDNGPPSLGVYQMIRELNALGYEYPRIRCALPEEFYRHIEQGYRDKIPVVRGNYENWWNWGVGSTAYETAAHKRTQETLAAAEMLATFAAASEAKHPYPYEPLSGAWKNLVLYAEHTWGSNGSGVDQQWFWKRNTALGPEVTANGVLRDAMSAMNSQVAIDGPSLVVWNFAPWKRTDVVRVSPSALPAGSAPADADGKPIAVQDCPDGMRAFVASDVPPLGYKALRVVQAQPAGSHAQMTATAEQLENRFYRIRFDPGGNIVSIVDKTRGGRELVDANCPERLNQFVYWYENKTPFTVQKATMKASVGPAMASVTADGACFGVDSMKRTVILHADIDRIDIVNDLVKSPSGFGVRGKGWPKEEGYFVFPLNVANFLLRHDMPSGNVRPIVDPNTGAPEQLPTTCTDHFTVKNWVDVSNQKDFGLTLSCLDAPLVMYGERRARTFDVNYKCKAPWIYGYVLNNLWYTNFQKTQPGRVVFRYSLRPHDGGDWLAGGAHRFGIETNSPLRAGRVDVKQAGVFSASSSLLNIEQPNVMLIAAKPAEANGEGVILRFNELEGKETKVTVDLARLNPRSAALTDLVENDQAPLALAGTKATFTVPGFGFATLRVIFGDAPAAVANVKAATDSYGTLVSWDAVRGARHYEVFRSPRADFAPAPGSYVASVSSPRYLDRQVLASTKGRYHYRVRAAATGRKGAFSPPAAAVLGAIDDKTSPATPVLYATALRFDKVALSWETPADNVAVKGYRLLRDGAQLADVPDVYNSWVDLRTAADKIYEYSIMAYDDAGNVSAPAAVKVSTAGFVVPPEAPAATLPTETSGERGPVSPQTRPARPGNIAPLAAVTVSSEFAPGFAGKHLVDGWHGEAEVGEWSSRGEKLPWLRLEWKEPVTISKVVVYDRPNPSDHARAGRLTFSDGEPVAVTGVPNNGSARAVAFPPRKAKWMKFEVTESAGANVGLAEIEVFSGD